MTSIIHWVPPPGKINWIHACNICNSYSLFSRPRDANNNNNSVLFLSLIDLNSTKHGLTCEFPLIDEEQSFFLIFYNFDLFPQSEFNEKILQKRIILISM